jgi:phage baseplate assembly protein W
MAFGAKKIFVIDTQPGTAVGLSLPFNAPATFTPTYTTQDAIRNNLINYFLTNKQERYLNNDFGGNLREYLFEQINSNTLNFIESDIQSLINRYFPNVKVDKINIDQYPDTNEIQIQLYYHILDTGINDRIQITFT